MNELGSEKMPKVEKIQQNARRKFLIQSSAGVAITTLPAQSVWGACNTSGLSGGSRSAGTVCIIPHVTGGRSPGSWTKFVDLAAPDNLARNKVREMFSLGPGGGPSAPSESSLNAAYCNVRTHIRGLPTLTLVDPQGIFADVDFNVEDYLNDSGPEKNFAAYYLNALFGFYGPLAPLADADELIQHVWGVMLVKGDANSTGPTNTADLEAAWVPETSTTSAYLPSGSGCS
ncbi:hypothetical protein [Paraglaciecola sp. 25GB23A]|uniref:hypothetical protein n=1 Tax=Paraglaciecola sp. 25GB23A TaxID=3156068 RepID=UPI0032AF734F